MVVETQQLGNYLAAIQRLRQAGIWKKPALAPENARERIRAILRNGISNDAHGGLAFHERLRNSAHRIRTCAGLQQSSFQGADCIAPNEGCLV